MSRRLLLINIAGLGRAAVGALTPRLAKLAERRLASEVGHKLMSRLLVDLRTLENSPTVANCRMNREREIRGTNSYAADLGFDAIQFLMERVEGRDSVAWLDLCCGTGRALIQAAEALGCTTSEISWDWSRAPRLGCDPMACS